MRLILILAFGFCLIHINAQSYKKKYKEGIIYFSDSTEKAGYIAFSTIGSGIQKKNPRVFLWANKENAKRQSFKAKLVDSVAIENDKIHYSLYVKNKNEKDFFTILYKDKVALVTKRQFHYGGAPDNGITFSGWSGAEYWIWDTSGDRAQPLSETTSWGKSFRNYARRTLKKCPKLVARIQKKELKKENIQEIIRIYNKCLENQ